MDKVPSALRSCKTWLLWKYVEKPGDVKPRKMPFYVTGRPRRGAHGSPEDRSNLAMFDVALERYRQGGYSGLGIAMLPELGLVGLDFDNCVSNGKIDTEVLHLVSGTYAEYSPSGRGIRAFMTGVMPNSKSLSTPGQYGFESFHSKGFLTITGKAIHGYDLAGSGELQSLTPEIRALYSRRSGKQLAPQLGLVTQPPVGLDAPQIIALLTHFDPSCGYDEWLKIGMAIHHETSGSGDGLDIWDDWSSYGSNYNGREEMQAKWDSFGQSGGSKITLRWLQYQVRALVPASEVASLTTMLPQSLIHIAAFAAQPPPLWRLQGLLPETGLGLVYGNSGSGKTFVVLDMMLCIAQGKPWFGRKAKQAHVTYVAAEGAHGIRKRLRAYASYYELNLERVPFHFFDGAPNLSNSKDVEVLYNAILEQGGTKVLVIDTLAQTTPGVDENTGKDMGPVLKHIQDLAKRLDCFVFLIHHSGKDASRGARGWSGIRAALDVEMVVAKDSVERVHLLAVTKQKDGEDGAKVYFALHGVQLGVDEDGTPIRSCVVLAASQPVKRAQGKWQELIMETMDELCVMEETVPASTLVEACMETAKELAEGTPPKKLGDSIKRALADLIKKGSLLQQGGNITMPQNLNTTANPLLQLSEDPAANSAQL